MCGTVVALQASLVRVQCTSMHCTVLVLQVIYPNGHFTCSMDFCLCVQHWVGTSVQFTRTAECIKMFADGPIIGRWTGCICTVFSHVIYNSLPIRFSNLRLLSDSLYDNVSAVFNRSLLTHGVCEQLTGALILLKNKQLQPESRTYVHTKMLSTIVFEICFNFCWSLLFSKPAIGYL